jgi:hypothetical protein
MGTYEKGILGPFTGTVGTVVGANFRGKNIMRSRPKKSNRLPSEQQIVQRDRFTTVNHFLAPLRSLINRYYGHRQGAVSRFNQATSYHMKEAVELIDAVFEIIYNKVLFAKGDLPGMQDPVVTAQEESSINIDWKNNSGQGLAKEDDTLIAVVYIDKLQQFKIFEGIATRDSESVHIDLPSYLKDLKVHCWATFVSDPRKLSATSTYLGEVVIT